MTDSKVVTRPAISLAQDRESSPARTGVLTTMLRPQVSVDVCKGDGSGSMRTARGSREVKMNP